MFGVGPAPEQPLRAHLHRGLPGQHDRGQAGHLQQPAHPDPPLYGQVAQAEPVIYVVMPLGIKMKILGGKWKSVQI